MTTQAGSVATRSRRQLFLKDERQNINMRAVETSFCLIIRLSVRNPEFLHTGKSYVIKILLFEANTEYINIFKFRMIKTIIKTHFLGFYKRIPSIGIAVLTHRTTAY